MDPLAMADLATPLTPPASSATNLAALAALATAGGVSPLRQIVLQDPETLLQFLEQAADKVRQQLVERRRSEEERLRALKLRALAELAAGAAHEINNPLAVISGQAQHLLKSEESLERAKALERVIAQCKRINHVLVDLMFFARPPEPRLRAVQVGRLLQQAVRTVAPLALERRVSLEPANAPSRLAARADPELLEKAVVCLLSNALQAAPTEGWVRLSVAAAANGGVEFVIEDSGPGLTPAEREHLFDPFFSGRSAGRGAGLGLCKVWRIAQLHGGEVRFESEPGKPTRFTLFLPGQPVSNGQPTRLKARLPREHARRNGRAARRHS